MIKLAQGRNAEKALVDMLCIAYAKELKAYHGYLHAYVTVTGPLETVYGGIYESFMEREMHHLEELGKKIIAMGGVPPTTYPPITQIAEAIYKGYDETLSALQDAEVETLEMYTKIHIAAEKAGDLPLVLLIEEIIQEEEEHHDELQRILMDIPKNGINVEKHDVLEVDAFLQRKIKLSTIFPDENAVLLKLLNDKLAGHEIELNGDAFFIDQIKSKSNLFDNIEDEITDKNLINKADFFLVGYLDGKTGVEIIPIGLEEIEHLAMDINSKSTITASQKRQFKMANIFENHKSMMHFLHELKDITQIIVDIEDEENDPELNPIYNQNMKCREFIMHELDNLDDDWQRDYFGDEEQELEEIEPALTMRNFV